MTKRPAPLRKILSVGRITALRFAVEVEADSAEALNSLISSTGRWLKSVGAIILERSKGEEDCMAAFIVEAEKDIVLEDEDLIGKVSIEPL